MESSYVSIYICVEEYYYINEQNGFIEVVGK